MSKPVSTNPANRFCDLTKYINSWTDLLGVDILDPVLKFNYRTWTTIFAIINFTVFTLYSMSDNGGDWLVSLKASLMMGGLLHGLGKFLTCIVKQKEMRSLTLFTQSIYAEYEKRDISYCSTLDTNIDRIQRIMKGIGYGYVVTNFLMVFTPLAMLVYNDSRMTVMMYEIPGLPIHKTFGYALTFLIQLVTICVRGFGFYAGDLFVMLGLTQILTFSDILNLKIKDLNSVLSLKAEKRVLLPVGAPIEGEEERQRLLIEMIKWHQLFTDYCRSVNKLYNPLITTQVLAMAYEIMASFCINLNGFHSPSAINFVLAAYCMSVYCVMGTKIEFAYDEAYENICNVSWYELSGEQRKIFGMILRESQSPQNIKLLGVWSLSVRTALQIIKLIYSASMLMTGGD
ncbi:uncharacterized protein Dana_GF18630 [Drosophila ananassae]|uniref:Odorant receptor n=1 Tax=Drosophila ananassae TaxID=7217 RepID=B3LWA8_DROAN|nr:putative odorant receptor 83c [Drosophila ananassae]EDV43741.1 uncharacterized protein Dana_GF18630 [Drosophila ananassae]